MGKTILVLLDACRYDTISACGGYLEHMIDRKLGAKYRIWGELPSMSRPMYETLMTGLPSSAHGIVSNSVIRPSGYANIFSLCRAEGLVTAAAAYKWYSELYATCPFHPQTDRYQLGSQSDIRHGIYYYEDQYPDSHLLLDGEFLRKTYDPHFLLLHSMNIDYWGHRAGSDSKEYYEAVQNVAELLSDLIPQWLSEGYQVVVTADHGMNAFGAHGGPTREQRELPLYLFGTPCTPGRQEEQAISQLNIAPLLCRLLHIPAAPGMRTEIELAIDQKNG
ncbi:MAG: alkaline phosphatase family protein [Angelakisella sp.]